MTKRSFVHASMLGIFVALAAGCSSSSSGSGSGGQPCGETGAQGSAACASCEQSNCSSELSTAESGCADFVSCTCAAGGSVQSCAAKAQEASCTSASMGISTCIEAHCATACGTGTVDGG